MMEMSSKMVSEILVHANWKLYTHTIIFLGVNTKRKISLVENFLVTEIGFIILLPIS